jgi:hypothetical protein
MGANVTEMTHPFIGRSQKGLVHFWTVLVTLSSEVGLSYYHA